MINAEVNLQVEMMNIILYNSKYNDICKNIIGFEPIVDEKNSYTEEIDLYFRKFADHQIYAQLYKMIDKGFFLGRPMELSLSLNSSNYLESRYELSEQSVFMSGGETYIEKFTKLFNNFRKDSEFDKFFYKIQKHYCNSVSFMNNCLNIYPFVDELNEFFGTSNISYNFIISNLCKGNFGIYFKLKDKIHVYSIYTCYGLDISDENNDFDKEQLCNTVFHELSHPVINPLSEKYIRLINSYNSVYSYLKPYKDDKYAGYNDWEECVNEHIIRAIGIYMLKKHNKKDYVNNRIEYEYELGYRYIKSIIKKLEYYENNREIYNTLDDFYPYIIDVFSEKI
ncbi:DUF4932 domain-containing protein [Paeniclostridium sordellii]|uniref:DUF4932 domain-containing protein n=1 Tax=Paraclostridium sordellii TaxID=1505 RepID=UPI0005DFA10A|nr:DUF4932 domain-containing protein [Paeniclostridium sordellii]MRZ79451.1 DUF4932 domain-containing protein [Paeniclostridium sordellii]MSB59366.1 DUF4932 domain-containing protein [Paeniclostridium sordellii]CEN24296.1 Uncharacterised protein [[Clostridium] sordellii] [Paeniclostridium sordellii]